MKIMSRKIRNIACSTYLASITCATSLFVEATINPIPASARTDRCIAVVNEINTAMNSKPSNGHRRDFPTEHSAIKESN